MEQGHGFLDGFHRWPDGWTDSIRFKDEDDAPGIRIDRDNAITWEFAGALAEVVHEFMVLAPPRRPAGTASGEGLGAQSY